MIRYSRSEAIALGLSRCYGSVCPKHPELDGERRVSGSCVNCAKEALQKYRKQDVERYKEHAKKSNLKAKEKLQNNPELKEKKLKRDAEYRKKNKETIASTISLWRKKNKEKVKQYTSKCKKSRSWVVHAGTVRRRLSKAQRTPAWLTEDDFWMINQAYEISAIRSKMTGLEWHVDHVIPLNGKVVSGLQVPLNLRVILAKENLSKGNSFPVI